MTRTADTSESQQRNGKAPSQGGSRGGGKDCGDIQKTPAGGGDTPNAGRNSFRAFSAYNQAGQ